MLLALFFIIPNVNVNKANIEKLTIYHCGQEDVFVPNQNNNENNNYEMLDYLNNNGTNLEIDPSINFGTLESSYYLQKDFIYYYEFDDNLTHKHSNKYYILSTNEYVCSRQLNSHTHSYAYLFSTFTYHKKKCICMEDYELEKHNYSIKGEFLVCSNCGASKPYIHLEI